MLGGCEGVLCGAGAPPSSLPTGHICRLRPIGGRAAAQGAGVTVTSVAGGKERAGRGQGEGRGKERAGARSRQEARSRGAGSREQGGKEVKPA